MAKHAASSKWPAKIWLKIAGAFILWAVLGVIVWLVVYSSFSQKATPSKLVAVRVDKGMTTAQISNRLREKGVVGSAFTFRVYMSINGADRAVQPGVYRLRTGADYSDLLKRLMKGPPKKLFTLVVPEGFTANQIATRLAALTGKPKEEFDRAMEGESIRDYDFRELPLGAKSLEGYLFPKTYVLDARWSPKKIVAKLLRQFEIETSTLDWSFARQKGLSEKDIITVASLIEGEAKVPEERKLVAAVIYNRLENKMPLQIDASVQYAMPRRKDVLTYNDYKYPSPYNTYLNPGLPPGPISNPGLDAIKAALAPANVDYLYYVLTSPDGRHTFTNNYSDFLKAKRGAGL